MEHSNGDPSDEPPTKVIKIDKEITSLLGFTLDRTLSDSSEKKKIIVTGRFSDSSEQAVVILEKTPFNESCVAGIASEQCKYKKHMQNDIYAFLDCYPAAELNGIKTTVIYPATEKHIRKYEYHPFHIIEETQELYQTVTEPYLQKGQFSLQWLKNIFEHKAEQDRVIYEDPDANNGFMLLYDLSWDGTSMESFYLLAFPINDKLISLRSLSKDNLPLLKYLQKKIQEIVLEKYGFEKSQLRIYFHYQPSFYHLHLHVNTLNWSPSGTNVERAHLLSTVINNIELVPDYYQRAILPFTVKESDNLFLKFEEKGLLKRVKPLEKC